MARIRTERSLQEAESIVDKNTYIRCEQVRLLYGNAPIGLAATAINSLLLGFILQHVVPPMRIAVWVACILLITLLRGVLTLKYQYASGKPRAFGSWGVFFLIGTALSGLAWGAAGVVLFPAESMPHQVFLAFVVGGMSAGAVVAYSPMRLAFLLFVIPDLVPITIRLLVEGGAIYNTMGLMAAVFLVLMLIAAFQMHGITRESLELQFENDALIVRLKSSKGSAEALVDRLKSQMAERRRAEEALRESEHQFRMLIETMNEGLGVYDREGVITFVNDKACELSGYSRDELIGRPITYFFDKANLSTYREQWKDRKQGKKGVYEVELLARDGRRVPCIISSSPVFDERGAFNGAIVAVTDISTLKMVEKAQRESERKYRLIFENSPLGIAHSNLDGTITACNDAFARMFGYSKEHLIGVNAMAILKMVEGMKSTVLDCLSGRLAHYAGDCRLERGEKAIAVKAYYSPVLSEDGSVSGCMGILEDITERKLAEQSLQASEKELRLLSSRLLNAQEEERKRIAGELHDSIGASLSAIKFSLERIREQMQKGEAGLESLDHLISITHRAINDARRMMADLRPSMLDDLGVIPTISWFVRQFREIYSHIDVDAKVEVKEDEIPEYLKTAIFRIIQEAFHNAAKHSKADLLNLLLEKRNNAIDLLIQDNGIGFDLDAAASNRSIHKGMGLVSMRERTELSGGVFTLRSVVGKGVVIRASWPTS